MFENIILVMSFCGSIAFIGYLLLHPLIERYCSLRWNYRFLKIIMLWYLFPLPYGILELKYWIQLHFGIDFSGFTTQKLESSLADGSYILIQNEEIQISFKVFITWLILIAFALCTFSILYWQIRRYLKLKKCYLQDAITEIPIHVDKQLQEAQKQVGVKKVKFVFSPQCLSPIAMGTISPVVILPCSMQERDWDKDYKFMVIHELNHIKNHDLWIRFLSLVVMAVHWFNPFCYLLFLEICNVSEFYCDFCTIRGEDEGGKKQYSHLILDMATEHVLEKSPPYIVSFTTNNKKFMIRRMQKMKYFEKKKRWVSCLIAVALCATGSAGALLYETPTVIRNDGEKIIDLENTEVWTAEEFPDEDISSVYPYDETLIYADGTMVDFSQYTTAAELNKLCRHDYETATVRIHEKDSKGGCTVTYWDAQVCRKCKQTVLKKIIKEVHYPECNH